MTSMFLYLVHVSSMNPHDWYVSLIMVLVVWCWYVNLIQYPTVPLILWTCMSFWLCARICSCPLHVCPHMLHIYPSNPILLLVFAGLFLVLGVMLTLFWFWDWYACSFKLFSSVKLCHKTIPIKFLFSKLFLTYPFSKLFSYLNSSKLCRALSLYS